jgi:hypothetical protein
MLVLTVDFSDHFGGDPLYRRSVDNVPLLYPQCFLNGRATFSTLILWRPRVLFRLVYSRLNFQISDPPIKRQGNDASQFTTHLSGSSHRSCVLSDTPVSLVDPGLGVAQPGNNFLTGDSSPRRPE